jgi:murein L,D-transpeptidase YafK
MPDSKLRRPKKGTLVDRRAFVAGGAALLASSVARAQPAPTPEADTAQDVMPLARAYWQIPRQAPVERIVVEKAARRMTLIRKDEPVLALRVALGRGYGPKIYEGDGRTPEGLYYIDGLKPDSQFYRAMHISYPNDEDRRRAADLGMRPGGLIMIHGLDSNIESLWQSNHWMFNWTNGCIAVTNAEMDLLWESVGLGTPIEIRA